MTTVSHRSGCCVGKGSGDWGRGGSGKSSQKATVGEFGVFEHDSPIFTPKKKEKGSQTIPLDSLRRWRQWKEGWRLDLKGALRWRQD